MLMIELSVIRLLSLNAFLNIFNDTIFVSLPSLLSSSTVTLCIKPDDNLTLITIDVIDVININNIIIIIITIILIDDITTNTDDADADDATADYLCKNVL